MFGRNHHHGPQLQCCLYSIITDALRLNTDTWYAGSTKCHGCWRSQKSLIDQHIALCAVSSSDYGITHISKPWVMLMTLSLMCQTIHGRFSRLQAHKLPPGTTSSGCHHSSASLVVKTPQQTHPASFPYMSLGPHMVLQHWDIRSGRSQITPWRMTQEKTPVGLCYWSVCPFGFTI